MVDRATLCAYAITAVFAVLATSLLLSPGGVDIRSLALGQLTTLIGSIYVERYQRRRQVAALWDALDKQAMARELARQERLRRLSGDD